MFPAAVMTFALPLLCQVADMKKAVSDILSDTAFSRPVLCILLFRGFQIVYIIPV